MPRFRQAAFMSTVPNKKKGQQFNTIAKGSLDRQQIDIGELCPKSRTVTLSTLSLNKIQ